MATVSATLGITLFKVELVYLLNAMVHGYDRDRIDASTSQYIPN